MNARSAWIGSDGGHRLAILNAHRFGDGRREGHYPIALFERALRHLHCRGVVMANPCDSPGTSPGTARTGRRFALTFDDGDESVYTHAWPLLQRFGYTATLFVLGGAGRVAPHTRLGAVGPVRTLQWSQLRELVEAGFGVGSHGVTHRDLTRLDDASVVAELRDSRARLEDALGIEIDAFAYPFGRYDARIEAHARARYAFTFSDRLALADTRRPAARARIDLAYFDRAALLPLLAPPLLGTGLGAYLAVRRALAASRARTLPARRPSRPRR